MYACLLAAAYLTKNYTVQDFLLIVFALTILPTAEAVAYFYNTGNDRYTSNSCCIRFYTVRCTTKSVPVVTSLHLEIKTRNLS